MPVRTRLALRSGTLCLVALTAGIAVPAAAAAQRESLLNAVSSPYLVAPARVGALYGVVTSGFRTAEHNRRVGGVFNSYHLQGRAIDVQRRPGVTHAMVDAALRRAGFNLIESLDEVDHSHFAFGDVAPARYTRPGVTLAATAKTMVPAAPPVPAAPGLLADTHGVLMIDDHHALTEGGASGVP